MNETTQLGSRKETTQLGNRKKTTQLCAAVDCLHRLYSRIGFSYLLAAHVAIVGKHLIPLNTFPDMTENPAVYLQVDDHVHPGNCLAAVSSERKQDLHTEICYHLPSWNMNEQMSYFSSFSDEWSRDLKSVQVLKQLSCRDESPDPSMSKIVLRNLIISSKYYKEEEAKELLEVITAERLETEQQQKLERQEQLSIEKLRLEIELSRNANQSATQNNGRTSRKIFR
ncbi:hypothetical protein TNCV_4820421 [Trichonephila clavipes]|nr:hypothetical protein TNCV_4820421 [Trichonephila clavipes]